MPGLLLDTLHGQQGDRRPIWLMRQAGRYLPEYRALRESKGGFLELVYDSAAAAEITLQPVRRFGFDGAILFSDILIVPHALGQDLAFLAGEGPRLAPPVTPELLDRLEPDHSRFEPIYETVRRTRAELPEGVTMLGFAGSPWTVATYMVQGEGSRDQAATRLLATRDPGGFSAIMERIVAVTIDYLAGQVAAGAEAVQLFDSWAGTLSPSQFERWVIGPTAAIVSGLKERHPGVPVIGFPKGAGGKLGAFARETGVDAIALDETVDPAWAANELPPAMPVQGNLDPMLLLAGGEQIGDEARRILSALADRPHVFNLGHGIDKDTPIANVERLLETVRAWRG